MAFIKRIRAIQGVGILADRSAKDKGLEFLQFNLVYGFNGSGKSTLSRIFACLESGKPYDDFPEGSSFEFEMDDGEISGHPGKLAGVESSVCVFNTDFIAKHLQWAEGRANSIFYISEEQADAAADLKSKQALLAEMRVAAIAQSKLVAANEKAFKSHKTDRARLVAGKLHAANRRYEALQLQADYEKLEVDPNSEVTEDVLNDLEEIARSTAAPPPLTQIQDVSTALKGMIETAREIAEISIGQTALKEIENHPSMVPWLKTGHDYHAAQNLDDCLFCGNELKAERKAKLAQALDDKLSQLMARLHKGDEVLAAAIVSLERNEDWPSASDVIMAQRPAYSAALNEMADSAKSALELLAEARRIVTKRLAQPTLSVEHTLPEPAAVAETCELFRSRSSEANALIEQHNVASADFEKNQTTARLAIRRHFIAEGLAEFTELKEALTEAQGVAESLETEARALQAQIVALAAKVKTHGPAADKITKLVQSYLGHGELTIFPAAEGYELHRHGKIVKGPPSEGEKTAIALCYFLSKLEEDGRSIDKLVVIVDDPISSLDTKAMNYACSLLRSRIEGASQIFVLTHNQHCMNEFKKAWRNRAKSTKEKPATAALLYLDVTMPEQSDRRCSTIVEMPKHLRGYDSEYHFLCSKALEFEAAGEGYSEYWFMMPNVIRRILDVFLGFKAPGSHPISQKLETLAKALPDIDPIRIKALERLTQVESHSDSLDDLIAHSSMTIEETRDANAALLELMRHADEGHVAAIRDQCKAA